MNTTTPFKKLVELIKNEKIDVRSIYVFAIISGIIQLSLPLGIQAIIGFVIGGVFSVSLIVLISLVILGVLFSGILQVQQLRIIEKIQQKLFHHFSFTFKDQILKLDLKKSDDYTPELMKRFLDVSILQKGLSKILLDIPLASIQIFLGLALLSLYHPLFLVLVLILLLIIIVIFYLTSKKGLETSIKESSYKYEVTNWLEEIARVIYIFKVNRQHEYAFNKLDNKVSSYLDYRTKHFKILIFQFKNLIFLKIIITAAMLIVGSYLLINQQLNIGQFVAAEIIILSMIASVEKVITNLDSLYDVLTSLDKLSSFESREMELSGSNAVGDYTKGILIDFNNVSFGYHHNKQMFSNLNFEIKSGETIAITGHDGVGKSSLIKLLSSMYFPDKGIISFNDIPIRNVDLLELRSKISVLFNKLDIFKGTVFENIVIGNSNISLHDVIKHSKKIQLDDFVTSLPSGYETPIASTGKKLPRSIIRKILLLRTLIDSRPLVLLEEPFVDIEEDLHQNVTDLILEMCKDSTLIVVTNNIEFIKKADRQFILTPNSITIK